MESTELVVIEQLNVMDVFTGGSLTDLLREIETKAKGFTPTVEHAKGRKQIASMAHKVSKSKVVLDNLGKELAALAKRGRSATHKRQNYAQGQRRESPARTKHCEADMSIPTKISCPGVGKYETELTRGAEILMRVFFAVSEQDATQQARRGYPEYRVTECRSVET